MFKSLMTDNVALNDGLKQLIECSMLEFTLFAVADVSLTATKSELLSPLGFNLSVTNGDGVQADITYGSSAAFYAAVGRLFSLGESCNIAPKVKRLGFMLDCSRNAVPKIETVKNLIRILALSGYNYLELYTEDTYEIRGEPYFGYLRGRYTSTEIKELNSYGATYGIELVPCIQTLAHLNAIFKWDTYSGVHDIDDILLAGEEKTYVLIEKMIASVAESFSSKRIMIGMDEAHNLGRGKFFERFGEVKSSEIMLKHLNRVVAICDKYNLKPAIWGDMFFRIAFKKYYESDENAEFSDEVIKLVPKNLQLIHWDYYNFDTKLYNNMLRLFASLGGKNVSFAGGVWKWMGYCPHITLSEQVLGVSIPSVNDSSVTDIMLTAWGDNGAECSLYSILSTTIYASELARTGGADIKNIDAISSAFLGYTHTQFKALEKCNLLSESRDASNKSKYLFYSDILLGLFDKRVKSDYGDRYKSIFVSLDEFCGKGKYAYVFETVRHFASCLHYKCEIAYNLRRAYSGGDKVMLKKIVETLLNKLIKSVDDFTKAVTRQWLNENKPFGLDVLHIRLGALKERISFAAERLGEYLDGRIEKIDELEEEILDFSREDNNYILNLWQQAVTVNPL